jgi:hypothetical protein
MIDTTPFAVTIRNLITTGTTERDLLLKVVRRFLELSPRDFVAALQDATAQARKHAARLH